ncbi:MAG TPA: hypothetical protein VIY86_06310, partial [Pirellulaceae bacterium]
MILFTSGVAGPSTVQALSVSVAGTYEIDVYGKGGTSGSYALKLLMNGLLEDENLGGGNNGTAANAEDLEASSVLVGTGGADRLAAVGASSLTEDFESGSFGGGWSTYSSDAQGRVRVTNELGGALGSQFAVLMDRNPSGANTLNEAIWSVDLSGAAAATLRFYHTDLGDEETTLPLTFVGHANGDGVAISDDGVNWYRVLNATSLATGVWQLVQVDLVAAATAAGMSLDSNFQVKFQQYDNFPLSTDGRGYDQVEIVTPAGDPDWYDFTLDDGETATAAVTRTGSTGGQVDLYAADGTTLLASGSPATNVTDIFHNFQDTTSNGIPDTYYLRVTSVSDYTLVVTRNADFDAEPNGSGTPQALPGNTGVLGHLAGGGDQDHYALAVTAGATIEVDASFPGNGPLQFINLLGEMGGLQLELLDPSNMVVATGSTSLVHAAGSTGTYVVRATSPSFAGEYFLDVAAVTAVDGDFNDDGLYD